MDALPPKGTVGLVDEEDRLEKEKQSLEKHIRVAEPVHHIMSEKEDAQADWEFEEKQRKQQALQEKARRRLAEAEAKNPALKQKNPHLL
jgi:hypothetical protein